MPRARAPFRPEAHIGVSHNWGAGYLLGVYITRIIIFWSLDWDPLNFWKLPCKSLREGYRVRVTASGLHFGSGDDLALKSGAYGWKKCGPLFLCHSTSSNLWTPPSGVFEFECPSRRSKGVYSGHVADKYHDQLPLGAQFMKLRLTRWVILNLIST